jgi:hypothetical protein
MAFGLAQTGRGANATADLAGSTAGRIEPVADSAITSFGVTATAARVPVSGGGEADTAAADRSLCG